MEYLVHILVLVGIYTMLAVSLDLLAGHTGLVSIAHAAFYGLGAYTSALLTVHFGAPFLAGVLAGMAVAALVSVVVSLPSLRLHDDYFVIATFGFQMILFSIFNNWTDLTRSAWNSGDSPTYDLGMDHRMADRVDWAHRGFCRHRLYSRTSSFDKPLWPGAPSHPRRRSIRPSVREKHCGSK